MQVDIDPIVEQRVLIAARVRGVKPEEYAGRLLEAALASLDPEHVSSEDLLSGLKTLAEHATGVANYPSDFFSREAIYGEHA